MFDSSCCLCSDDWILVCNSCFMEMLEGTKTSFLMKLPPSLHCFNLCKPLVSKHNHTDQFNLSICYSWVSLWFLH